MFLFLAIIVQMGHGIIDRHTNYWIRAEQFFTHFYLNTKTRDHFLHILQYLQVTDNGKEIHNNDDNYGRLWKMSEVFDILDVACLKFYNPSGHFATDKVNVLFQGKGCIQKHTHFKSKFTSSVTLMATRDMAVYFGKDRKWATKHIAASHATVKQLT